MLNFDDRDFSRRTFYHLGHNLYPSEYFCEVNKMICKRIFLKAVFISVLTLFEMAGLDAQINVKIGYNIGFPQLSVNDEILRNYIPVDSELVQPFGSIGFMHGIQLGLRQRWGSFALEVGWENMSRDKMSLSYNAVEDSFKDRQYNYAFNGFNFGLDNYIGRFGIGSTFLAQKMSINRVVGNNDLKLISEQQIALRLQFIWQVQQSDFVSLVVKPYYQFALKGYDMTALATDLNVSGLANLSETPKVFGIALVFYNGRQ